MNFIDIVKRCNCFYESSQINYVPFFVGEKKIGIIRLDILKHLRKHSDVFLIHEKNEHTDKVELNPELSTFSERSERVKGVLQDLREKNVLKSLAGWRNEDFDVWYKLSEPSLMKIERTGTCLFGVKQCGVHINGFVQHPQKGQLMWLGKRAKNKSTWPGMLDQMAAGGLSAGEKFTEAAKRECQEEASVPEHLLENLKSVGCISYMYEDERGVFPEIQYIFDLELPQDFVPVNSDGEVESFQLLPIAEVKNKILENNFKYNCAVVVLDFLIRHGYVDPDNEPNYYELVRWLHDPLF